MKDANTLREKQFSHYLLCTTLLFCSSCSYPRHVRAIDSASPEAIDRILATNPATLIPEQFYQYEFALLAGFSGSGGSFLEEPHIAWLRKAEVAFKARGVQVEDKYDRDFAIADSYFNSHQYEKALDEFRRLKVQSGIELAEWFINNRTLRNAGGVKLIEYDGEIPCDATELTRVENERYVFAAYFKGPIYRYDKLTKKHALIYAPRDKYDWCDKLAFNGKTLIIRLRDDAGMYAFNNERNELHSVCNVLRENNPFRDDVVLTSVK